MEVLSSKYRLGDGQRIDNRERHQALDEEMQLFGVLTDDLRLSSRRQAKTETFQFMDMVQEYRSMLQGLKVRLFAQLYYIYFMHANPVEKHVDRERA
jgi:hypothetical protein